MRAVAGVDNRTGGISSGRHFGEVSQARLALIAKTGAARPGEFHGDPPAGPMADDNPGQGCGDHEKKIKGDNRNG